MTPTSSRTFIEAVPSCEIRLPGESLGRSLARTQAANHSGKKEEHPKKTQFNNV